MHLFCTSFSVLIQDFIICISKIFTVNFPIASRLQILMSDAYIDFSHTDFGCKLQTRPLVREGVMK
jgi:hypothetical protein